MGQNDGSKPWIKTMDQNDEPKRWVTMGQYYGSQWIKMKDCGNGSDRFLCHIISTYYVISSCTNVNTSTLYHKLIMGHTYHMHIRSLLVWCVYRCHITTIPQYIWLYWCKTHTTMCIFSWNEPHLSYHIITYRIWWSTTQLFFLTKLFGAQKSTQACSLLQ